MKQFIFRHVSCLMWRDVAAQSKSLSTELYKCVSFFTQFVGLALERHVCNLQLDRYLIRFIKLVLVTCVIKLITEPKLVINIAVDVCLCLDVTCVASNWKI